MTKTWYIHTDGSNSRPKGDGPAGSAFIIYSDPGKNKAELQDTVNEFCMTNQPILLLDDVNIVVYPHKEGTNNYAELYAIESAVQWFQQDMVDNEEDTCVIKTDSEWCALTIANKLGLEAHKKPYKTTKYPKMYEQIVRFWDYDRMSIMWVPREQNSLADQLAKLATERAKRLHS